MRLHRVGLVALLVLALFMAPCATAQQPTTVHRIGRLSAGSPPVEPTPSLKAFRQGLRDRGYVEGQNMVIEHRHAEGSTERLHDLAAELVQLPVAVLVAGGLAATRAAQHATNTIPIVMLMSDDSVREGLITSLARPGGNITGVTFMARDLSVKRLDLLKEVVPHATRIAVLMHPAAPGHQANMDDLAGASRALGVALHVLELRRADELEDAFAAMTREGAEGLLVLADPLLIDGLRSRIAALAARHRLPAIYPWKMYVEAGGLMSYAPNLLDMNQRVTYYVDRILKGAKPADLPVEQPTKFELVINLETAQALGVTIPPSVLLQANEVIR